MSCTTKLGFEGVSYLKFPVSYPDGHGVENNSAASLSSWYQRNSWVAAVGTGLLQHCFGWRWTPGVAESSLFTLTCGGTFLQRDAGHSSGHWQERSSPTLKRSLQRLLEEPRLSCSSCTGSGRNKKQEVGRPHVRGRTGRCRLSKSR